MLRRAEDMPGLTPPEDTSARGPPVHVCGGLESQHAHASPLQICTLFVGGLDARVDEESLKDHFYAFGELQSVRVVRTPRLFCPEQCCSASPVERCSVLKT